MCGRFVSASSEADVSQALFADLSGVNLGASYNVSPTASVYGVRTLASGQRSVDVFRWGLAPEWISHSKKLQPLINARLETVDQKPAFANAFKFRRCVIPANGFFEWQKMGSANRQPFYVYKKDSSLLFMAGIWELGVGDEAKDFSILTTRANSDVAHIHHRMPVLLDGNALESWLMPGVAETQSLKNLLLEGSAERLDSHYGDRRVGNASLNDSDLISEVPPDTLW